VSDAFPAILQRYKVIRRIAMGGMAEVFLAELSGAGGFKKQVAIKRILPQFAQEPRFVEMFLDEARLAALFHHPSLVQIYELGELDGTLCMVMEYVRGASLAELSRRAVIAGQPVPSVPVAARIIQQAAEGLDYAHEFQDPETGAPLGLVHRDVSPQNILVAREGIAKVMDFGIAKAVGNLHHTNTGTLKGKLAYMSPEQLNGQPLDRRSDVWALGVVLYELVAGKRPFAGESEASVFRKILIDPLPPMEELRAEVPARLRTLIKEAMERDPAKRTPSAGALARGIEDWMREDDVRVSSNDVAEWVKGLLPTSGVDPLTGAPVLITPSRPGTQPKVAAPPPSSVSSPGPQIEIAEGSDWKLSLEVPSGDLATRTSDSRALLGSSGSQPSLVPPTPPGSVRSPWPYIASGAIVVAGAIGLVAVMQLKAVAARGSAGQASGAIPAPTVVAPPVVAVRPQLPAVAPAPAPTPAVAPPEPARAERARPRPSRVSRHDPASAHPPPTVAAASPLPVPATPDLPGTLVINTDPWSRVTIDGRDVGETPLQGVSLSAGAHTLVCVNPETGLSHRETITLRPGERVKKFVPLGK